MDTKRAARYFEDKMSLTMGIAQLKRKMDAGDDDFQIVDTRSLEAYEKGHIPGAVWINADEDKIAGEWDKLSKSKVNVIYCYGILCLRGPRVCLQAAKKEFPVMELHGNFDGWKDYGFDVETGSPA